jgi:NagD protein
MEQAGFQVGWDRPQAVVVGFDTTLDYERLCRAAYWIAQDVPFIATHPDLICPTDEPTVLVDCGAICECLKAATGRQPVVLGKPDPSILRTIAERHLLRAEDVAMVGDRLYTDIAMARAAGALPVLVLTGEATASEAQALPPGPLLIVENVGELGNLLSEAQTTGVRR